ncbi:MAG TPA: amino acid adenylation domain-containing protein, partial [Longimicrobiaceae bacterium]
LPSLPLTPSGKTDRRALPEPGAAEEPGSRAAPRTPAEEVLAGIWADVLGRTDVGAGENFFALGGHSLLATRVVSRVRELFRVELPLRTVFEAPTVEELARRVESARSDGSAVPAPPVVPVGRGGPLPLSFAQERLWFLEQMRPEDGAYNIPITLRLSGALDVPAMERSLSEVVRRHEALRTVFPARGGRPVQSVLPPAPLALPVEELEGAGEAVLRERLRTEARRAFDLEAGPLFRARLFRRGGEEHVLLLCMHHVVSDGWSMEVMLRELAALYPAYAAGGEPALPLLPVQYADFAVWQREHLAGEATERQLAYWRERLAGAPAVLELPSDRPRPSVHSFRGALHDFLLPAELAVAVRTLGRRGGTTPFMTLLAAWQLLLGKLSGQGDLVVGAPVAGRTRRETEELIGFFVNAVPMRAELDGDPTVGGLLARVRETTLGAYGHQDVPFERLVEELRVERSLSHSPVFQVMFTLQSAAPAPPALLGLALELGAVQAGGAKYDLTLALAETPDGLHAELEYATDLFDAATAARIAARYRRLVEGMAVHPERRVSELSLLDAAEEEQVLRGWNATDAPYRPDVPVHTLVACRASQRPDATAVVDGASALTRGELVERARALAGRLRGLGVGPEERVAVCMERGAEMVVAQLAVLFAGGAFVPLDPAYPAERIAFALADSGARVLLTQERLRERLSAPWAASVEVVVEGDAGAGTPAPEPEASPDSLAYVIYTSGSTGTPKGVAVTHRGLANLAAWHRRAFGVGEGDRATQLAGAGFDASVWEVWPYLAAGAEVHVVEDAVRAEPAALRDRLVEAGITVAFLPTPLAEAALALEWPADAALRTMLTGGDTLHVRPAAGLPFALVNAYGPTENTVVATAGAVAPGGADEGAPSIGGPVANVRAYVLDAALRPVPVGVPGELLLGGDGLARGYLDRPALTAERFVPDPFGGAPGARLYRTGDRVRRLADGTLEFLGRLDLQVKLRGFRIEVAEVETALAAHPDVVEAAVEARGAGAGRRLVGWVVPAAGAAPGAAELREHLVERLPEYMVPSAFVLLDALPLTPNGKIDRAALPEPERDAGAEGAAPRSGMESSVAAVWREALRLDHGGVEDNFFELGGHSLLVAQVQARLREVLGREVSMVDLFRFPTVAALAAHLEPEAAPERSGRQGSERAAARRAMLRRRGGRGGT